jgi:hypothetical protein
MSDPPTAADYAWHDARTAHVQIREQTARLDRLIAALLARGVIEPADLMPTAEEVIDE